MSYTRHNWACGEVVTNELLNNIEDGVEEALDCCGGGGTERFLIKCNIGAGTMDRTSAEIQQAYADGKELIFVPLYNDVPINFYPLVYASTPQFGFSGIDAYSIHYYTINTTNEPPVLTSKHSNITWNV